MTSHEHCETSGHRRSPGQTSLELHSKAMSVASDLKTKYLELFEILLEVESRQIYLSFDVISLYTYCVELLQLSPSTASDFVTVVRKSLEVEELATAIRSKRTTIYKARKICPVLTEKNAKGWIDLACECPTRIVEKAVAQARPREAIQESMKYVSCDTLEFKLAVSEEWEALLKQTKDLMSQKHRRAVSSEEALQALMQSYCEKEDPVRKAERAVKRAATRSLNQMTTSKMTGEVDRSLPASPADLVAERTKNQDAVLVMHQEVALVAESQMPSSQAFALESSAPPRSRYRLSLIEHEVNLRDQGRCVHVDQAGERCKERRWLEKHHLIPFAEGGEHTKENLVTLCSAHHRMWHRAQGYERAHDRSYERAHEESYEKSRAGASDGSQDGWCAGASDGRNHTH